MLVRKLVINFNKKQISSGKRVISESEWVVDCVVAIKLEFTKLYCNICANLGNHVRLG